MKMKRTLLPSAGYFLCKKGANASKQFKLIKFK